MSNQTISMTHVTETFPSVDALAEAVATEVRARLAEARGGGRESMRGVLSLQINMSVPPTKCMDYHLSFSIDPGSDVSDSRISSETVEGDTFVIHLQGDFFDDLAKKEALRRGLLRVIGDAPRPNVIVDCRAMQGFVNDGIVWPLNDLWKEVVQYRNGRLYVADAPQRLKDALRQICGYIECVDSSEVAYGAIMTAKRREVERRAGEETH